MLQTRLYSAVKAKQCAPACVLSTGQQCIQVIPTPNPPSPPATPPFPPAPPTPPLLPRTASGFASYAPSPPPLVPFIFSRPTTIVAPQNGAPASSSRLSVPGKAFASALTFGSSAGYAPVSDTALAPGQGAIGGIIPQNERQVSAPAPTQDASMSTSVQGTPMVPPTSDQNGENSVF